MNNEILFKLLAPLGLIFLGIMAKVSSQPGWRSVKKNWIILIGLGLFLLSFYIYKYLHPY